MRVYLRCVRHRALYAGRYREVFCSLSDIAMFKRLMRSSYAGPKEAEPVPVCIRQLDGARVLARPGTADWVVLWDTFFQQYHLPPADLPQEAVIVDLGANIGSTLAHLAHLHSAARLVGVEMDDRNAALAQRNVAPFGRRCKVVHAAVWSEDGWVDYAGVDEFGFRIAGPGKGRSVRAVRMDTLISEQGLDRIDYLKVDIEGAEAEVFREASGWLERVQSLKVEVHPPASLKSISDVLEANGFRSWKDERHWACVAAVKR